ncbi:MAG TPA: hypothetical protein VNY05_02195 [Candidatus Acidoferrales bacterium]|nr:hypothetical protein [Candidatus Acidoferrales bacterium]
MWIFTRYGFFSIACARRPNGSLDAQTVMVRSRRRSHLQNLKSHFREIATAEVVALPKRDYRYRLILPKTVWATIIAALADEQEWSNFKNEAARFQGAVGADYVHALHEVWEVMYNLQESEAAGGEASRLVKPDRGVADKPAAKSSDANSSDTNSPDAQERLTSAVRTVYAANSATIQKMKSECAKKWAEPDFIWERLLGAAATLGNSRGAKLVHDDKLHDPVRYPALLPLTEEKRRDVLTQQLSEAKVRMAVLKAKRLVANFARIKKDGGPDAVKRNLEDKAGREEKIVFMRTFHGIGPKYARDIMMDAYHPDFHNSIAFDVRLKKVAAALGMTFVNYESAEQFFLGAAARVGINGWELDRLLYNYTNDVLAAIGA